MPSNLKTGEMRAANPLDYMTKIAAVCPAKPGTPHPLWTTFLKKITAGSKELQDYLQRVVGYCLTGEIREHVVFFLYGTGANGKTVFINTILRIMNTYAITIGSEMLMVSRHERHPTEVARLRGIRLAIASEIEIGRQWAESKLKELTGGDRLRGRFMRNDFFEFTPKFKLMVVGNHKPALRGVDEAIRRRLHLIPFTITIPAEERDKDLEEKLKAEWPAILRWGMDGSKIWYEQGLQPPKVVTQATADYLASEDSISLWLQDCCATESTAWEPSADLWRSWKAWAEHANEEVGTRKRFGQALVDHGLNGERRHAGRGHLGVRLIRQDYTDDPRTGY